MPRSRKKKNARRQNARYSTEMLNVAVDLVRCKKLSSYDAEKQFGIPRRTILNRCNNCHGKAVGHPTLLSEDDEKQIANTINVAAEFGCPLTLLDLRIVVYHHLEKNEKSHIFHGKMPGERWARNFLVRHNMTQRTTQNIKRSRASKTVAEINEYFKHLKISVENVPPSHLLNYDETNLSDDPGCNKAIFKKGTKHPERVLNSSKSSVSIMFAGTADGKCLPPYVVYKAENLWNRWCRDGPPNCRYNRTKSGWFDMVCFDDWFQTVVLPWATALDGPKVIIGDNLSSHLSVSTIQLCREHDIRFVFLPRNATHLTQPLDLSFFGPMKKHWRKILLQYKLSNHNAATINKCHFPQLLKQLMENIEMNNEKNLKSGFEVAGIFPLNASKVTQNIPEETKEMKEKFDQTLLDYLKASREAKPMKGGRNNKLQITAGKSVSGEEAIVIQNPVKSSKPKKKIAIVNDIIDINKNKEFVQDNNKNETRRSTSIVPSKITLLSDVRFTKQNTPFYKLNNKPLQLTEIDKNIDLFSGKSITDSDNKNACEGKSKKEAEVHERTKMKSKSCRKKTLVKRRKTVVEKKNIPRKRMRLLSSGSTTNCDSDIQISLHSDSDILDVPNETFNDDDTSCDEAHTWMKVDKENYFEDMNISTEKTRTKKHFFEKESQQKTDLEEGEDEVCVLRELSDMTNMTDEMLLRRDENDIKMTDKTKEDSIQIPEIEVESNQSLTWFYELKEWLDKETVNGGLPTEETHNGEIINQNEDDTQDKKSKKQEDSLKKTKQRIDNETDKKESFTIKVGDKVLTRYFNRKSWKYYIGEIESIDNVKKLYSISYYKTIGKHSNNSLKFIKQKRITDKDTVQEDSIVKVVELLQICENPEEYVTMCDEDDLYF